MSGPDGRDDSGEGQAAPISLAAAFAALRFLPDRSPETGEEAAAAAFARLAEYRDGGIFIGHYAGNSEWERHLAGDEIVHVLDGETTLFLWDGETEHRHRLPAGSMMVVPTGTWHRFETPRGVKILTVTPQPTDHRRQHPRDDAS